MSFLKKILSGEKKQDTQEKDSTPAKESARSYPDPKKPAGKIIAGVIYYPHMTEKTSAGSAEGKYAFSVHPRANKIQVKRAVETRYGVDVKNVHMLNMPGKERRRGKQIGIKAGFKKAIVQVKEGQVIETQ